MSGPTPSIRRGITAVPDSAGPNFEGGRETHRLLTTLAECTGGDWAVDGEDRDPIVAAMVVVFSADGEPTPFLAGISGENWTDFTTWVHLVEDAKQAIHDLRWQPTTIMGVESTEPESVYAHVRQRWCAREQSREHYAAERIAKAERTAAERPFLCDCGFRAKTKGGLTNHLNRSWRHR